MFPSFAVFKGCAEAIFQIEDIHVFFLHQDNSTKISILKYLLLENSAISSCEILGSQRKLLFSRFLAVFLQIHPKPKVATLSSQRPSQGPLTWIVQFDCKTLANTTKIWQFQVQIPFDRFCRQIYSPRATCCDCTNFYFKWLRATPKFATSL